MADFTWRAEYDTGIEEIDVQHRRFLALIRHAQSFSAEVPISEGLRDALYELLCYARFHFSSEESLMGVYDCPDIAQHVREHQILFQELEQRISLIHSGKEMVAALMTFLLGWFVNHTQDRDRGMAGFIRKNRLELPDVGKPA